MNNINRNSIRKSTDSIEVRPYLMLFIFQFISWLSSLGHEIIQTFFLLNVRKKIEKIFEAAQA